MYTRRNRCLPIFHSTSTTSSPSERAYSLGGFANFLQLQAETPRPRPVLCPLTSCQGKYKLPHLMACKTSPGNPAGPTKKWACAHPVVRPDTERSQSICPGQDKSKAQGPAGQFVPNLSEIASRPKHSNETRRECKRRAITALAARE